MDKDITSQVRFGNNDDEYLPLTKCICGAEFNIWEFDISIYKDNATQCPECNRYLYFTNEIKVYEIID